MNARLDRLQENLCYRFNNEGLLLHALTHTSYANEMGLGRLGSNERLEFLGDAVLELVSSEFFFNKYPEKPEGDLTRIRAGFVCETALAGTSESIHLSDFIILGKGEEATGGRKRPSIISDAFEAVIGAVYLDGGFASAKEVILRFILNDVDNKLFFYDSKSMLQELVQKDHGNTTVAYRLVNESGPDHMKEYTIEVLVDDKVLGTGTGSSKKNAEQKAAYEALKILKEA